MGSDSAHLALAVARFGVLRPRLRAGRRRCRCGWAGVWLGTLDRWWWLLRCRGCLTLHRLAVADVLDDGLAVCGLRGCGNDRTIRRCGSRGLDRRSCRSSRQRQDGRSKGRNGRRRWVCRPPRRELIHRNRWILCGRGEHARGDHSKNKDARSARHQRNHGATHTQH